VYAKPHLALATNVRNARKVRNAEEIPSFWPESGEKRWIGESILLGQSWRGMFDSVLDSLTLFVILEPDSRA
jgi:hypothetical protein